MNSTCAGHGACSAVGPSWYRYRRYRPISTWMSRLSAGLPVRGFPRGRRGVHRIRIGVERIGQCGADAQGETAEKQPRAPPAASAAVMKATMTVPAARPGTDRRDARKDDQHGENHDQVALHHNPSRRSALVRIGSSHITAPPTPRGGVMNFITWVRRAWSMRWKRPWHNANRLRPRICLEHVQGSRHP